MDLSRVDRVKLIMPNGPWTAGAKQLRVGVRIFYCIARLVELSKLASLPEPAKLEIAELLMALNRDVVSGELKLRAEKFIGDNWQVNWRRRVVNRRMKLKRKANGAAPLHRPNPVRDQKRFEKLILNISETCGCMPQINMPPLSDAEAKETITTLVVSMEQIAGLIRRLATVNDQEDIEP